MIGRSCFRLLGQLALMASLASPVHAAGFDTARFASEHGHAAGPTPFAVHYNPAALSLTHDLHVALDGTLALHGARYRRTETTVEEPADARGANLGKAKLLDVIGGPSLAAAKRFGSVTLGAGVYAPMSGVQRWQGNDAFRGNEQYPGAQDGRARFHLIEGQVALLCATLAVAYRIEPFRLSVGVAGNLYYAQLQVVKALTPSFDDNVRTEGRAHADVSGIEGGFSAGLTWEALEQKLWLAVSYQAPPGFYDGHVLEGTLRTSLAGSVETHQTDLHETFPDVLRWAVRARPSSRYELRLFGDYTRWSMLERQCLTERGAACDLTATGAERDGTEVLANYPRDWQDTFSVRAGASYFVGPAVELFVGAGYDGNAVPDATLDPSLIDGHDLSGTLGGRFGLGSRFALLASYTHLHMLPRDTTGKSDLGAYELPSGSAAGAGEYEQWVGLFTAMLEFAYD